MCGVSEKGVELNEEGTDTTLDPRAHAHTHTRDVNERMTGEGEKHSGAAAYAVHIYHR